jgi:hypothetical protein
VTRKTKLDVRVGVLVGGGEAELKKEEGGGAEGEAGDARLRRQGEISDGVSRKEGVVRWEMCIEGKEGGKRIRLGEG